MGLHPLRSPSSVLFPLEAPCPKAKELRPLGVTIEEENCFHMLFFSVNCWLIGEEIWEIVLAPLSVG